MKLSPTEEQRAFEDGLRRALAQAAPGDVVEQWQALGYRGAVTHYVGMSHYPALVAAGTASAAITPGTRLAGYCRAALHHADGG